eukprot:347746_1
MAPDHTVFNLCKFPENATKTGRILDAKQFNGFYGFYYLASGVADEGGRAWITEYVDHFGKNWVLSSQCLDLYRGNGQDFTKPGVVGTAGRTNLDINGNPNPYHLSDWA